MPSHYKKFYVIRSPAGFVEARLHFAAAWEAKGFTISNADRMYEEFDSYPRVVSFVRMADLIVTPVVLNPEEVKAMYDELFQTEGK